MGLSRTASCLQGFGRVQGYQSGGQGQSGGIPPSIDSGYASGNTGSGSGSGSGNTGSGYDQSRASNIGGSSQYATGSYPLMRVLVWASWWHAYGLTSWHQLQSGMNKTQNKVFGLAKQHLILARNCGLRRYMCCKTRTGLRLFRQ